MKALLLNPTLAVISGDSLVRALVWIIVGGLIVWLLDYLIKSIPLPPPFQQVARVILIVFAVLLLISILLSLVGHPIIAW